MYADRRNLYEQIERARNSRLIAYVTGDRREMDTKIHSEVLDLFTQHLDSIGDVRKLSLLLYTRGGDTLAAWTIANLLRQFCNELEVIVPFKCHSAGTLMCLAASRIVMTKQATLGPIDPSVNTPLNPQIAGAPSHVRMPVSVEDVNGFVEFARQTLKKRDQLQVALQGLTANLHPLVLGNAYRARGQIRMLAKKLMGDGISDQRRRERVLDFLCSESGSHDYTIDRREARDELGLPIEKPSEELYGLIKRTYDDLAAELELTQPFDPNVILGGAATVNYTATRAVIESLSGGSHAFISAGRLSRQQVQVQPGVVQLAVRDERAREGWEHRAT